MNKTEHYRRRSKFWSFDGYRYATNSGAWSTNVSSFFCDIIDILGYGPCPDPELAMPELPVPVPAPPISCTIIASCFASDADDLGSGDSELMPVAVEDS